MSGPRRASTAACFTQFANRSSSSSPSSRVSSSACLLPCCYRAGAVGRPVSPRRVFDTASRQPRRPTAEPLLIAWCHFDVSSATGQRRLLSYIPDRSKQHGRRFPLASMSQAVLIRRARLCLLGGDDPVNPISARNGRDVLARGGSYAWLDSTTHNFQLRSCSPYRSTNKFMAVRRYRRAWLEFSDSLRKKSRDRS